MNHVIICDDDPIILKMIAATLEEFPECQTHAFTNPEDTLDYAISHPVTVAILDIIMDGMNGVQLARNLREHGFLGEIIFLTCSNDYAAESYAVKATDYILKPVSRETIKGTYERLLSRNTVTEPGLNLITKQLITNISFREIIFVESNSRQVHFHLNSGQTISLNANLKDYIKILSDDDRFAIPHTSFIVNMDFIKTIINQEVILKNGRTIPISRRQVSFKKDYLNYIARG